MCKYCERFYPPPTDRTPEGSESLGANVLQGAAFGAGEYIFEIICDVGAKMGEQALETATDIFIRDIEDPFYIPHNHYGH